MAEDDGTHGLCPYSHHVLVSIKGKEGGQSSYDQGMLSSAIGEVSGGRTTCRKSE